MFKYRTTKWSEEIQGIDVVKESDKSVWLTNGGRRESKASDWHHYWDTFEDARNYLIRRYTDGIETAKSSLQRHTENLEKVKAMRPTN